jgi:pimeloyl-ACP methyl ester carboxylesterase
MTIYFLSGLGADERALRHLELPAHIAVAYLPWLPPSPKETLEQYAGRMAQMIDASKPFVLAGLSFGGVLAVEMQQYIQPRRTILISSIACRRQMPWYYRLAGRLRLHRLLPSKTANRPNFLTYWLFGLRTAPDKRLLRDILTHTNTHFSKWAVNALLRWKRREAPPGIIRIHGTNDRVLPLARSKANFTVPGGGHLVVNRAAEVSGVIKEIITGATAGQNNGLR